MESLLSKIDFSLDSTSRVEDSDRLIGTSRKLSKTAILHGGQVFLPVRLSVTLENCDDQSFAEQSGNTAKGARTSGLDNPLIYGLFRTKDSG